LELVHEEFRLLCAIRISPNIFVLVVELGVEGNIPSKFCGIGTFYCTFGGSRSKSCICSFIAYSTCDSGSFLGNL
jgi:hypothetical protein